MKKTLVALAVLAASGASFAQVAITGGVAMGWSGGSDATGAQSSGLGVDTATLDFGATEDLGGGMKVEAHLGFDTVSRAAGAVGGDTTMALSTSAFTVKLGSTQLNDYLQGGTANVSGTFNTFEGRLLGAKAIRDWASIIVPVGPFTLSLTEYEAGTALGLGKGSGGLASETGQRNTQYQVAYAAGALKADAAFKSYDSASTPTALATSTAFGLADAPKSIVRGSVSYDFGVAKVGAGTAVTSLIVNGTDTESMISVAVPFGAVSFGAQYFNRVVNGTTGGTFDFNQSGYGLELDYALSKSTKVAVNYLNWQAVSSNGALPAGGSTSNLTEIALVKSF